MASERQGILDVFWMLVGWLVRLDISRETKAIYEHMIYIYVYVYICMCVYIYSQIQIIHLKTPNHDGVLNGAGMGGSWNVGISFDGE